MKAVLWILLISLHGLGRDPGYAAESPKQTAPTNSPWTRIVMVGASATAGFTASEPLGGPNTPIFRLSRYVDAALLVAHEPVQNVAHALFFMQWESQGRHQIEEALKAKPTLVIGLDFLFWFCYGEGLTDKQRQERFEQGLKFLEPIQCPLVIGDLPDASGAVGRVLRATEVPSATVLAAANRRLKQWGASRPQVVVVSLSEFLRTVSADQALRIHGRKLEAGKTRMLLQEDQLHPSPAGAAVLALAILDAFQSGRPAPATNEVRWDTQEVFRLGLEAAGK